MFPSWVLPSGYVRLVLWKVDVTADVLRTCVLPEYSLILVMFEMHSVAV